MKKYDRQIVMLVNHITAQFNKHLFKGERILDSSRLLVSVADWSLLRSALPLFLEVYRYLFLYNLFYLHLHELSSKSNFVPKCLKRVKAQFI